MSAVAQPTRGRSGPPGTTTDSAREELKSRTALGALAEFAAGALAREDSTEAMRRLADRACEVIGLARCAVYVRDDERSVYVGLTAHPAELRDDVRRLVVGGSTDRITREIVQTREPVLIRDVNSDPRALTTAVRTYRLRSLLGVPMIAGDEVLGVMMFDNGPEPHRFAPLDVEIASAFAALGAAALCSSRERGKLSASLETAARQNKLLRRAAVAEHRLSNAILGGGGLSAVVELVAGLTGKPAALFDAHGQPVASASPADSRAAVTLLPTGISDESIRASLEEVVTGASTTIEPSAGDGVRRRHLVAPVDLREDRWGWLVIMEHACRLGSFDDFLIRRAATHVALELTGRRQLVASGADARALLARQLVRGTTVENDLRRQAEYLGISLEAHRLVAYFNADPSTIDPEPLVAALCDRLGRDVLSTSGPEGLALLIEVPSDQPASSVVRRVEAVILQALSQVSEQPRLIGLSTVCRSPSEIPGGYRMAVQVAGCIENFFSRTSSRVLSADDLGPGRLFVANTHPEELRRFVEDVLGRLLARDEASAELVRTLEAFYETGRSVRLAAERLGVHENTVRYRLSRVHGITGLDVAADADDQLSVQVALLVLRLQGHPSLKPFEERGSTEAAVAA